MSRVRLLALAVVAVMALAVGSHSRYAWSEGGTSEITILSSAAIQGELAPCG